MKWIVFFAVLFFCGFPVSADQQGRAKHELQQVEEQIQATSKQIGKIRARADELTQALTENRRALSKNRTALKRKQAELKKLRRALKEQQAVSDRAASEQQQLQGRLQKRLISLYKSGEVGLARLLFSATSPTALMQDIEFMERLVASDRALLKDFRHQLERSRQELEKLKGLSQSARKAVESTQLQQRKLRTLRKKQKHLLSDLKHDRKVLDTVLGDLESRANRLSHLVRELESKPSQTYTGVSGPFAMQRGRLPWPVAGPVRIGFGPGRHPILKTRYDSHGIEIEIDPGTAIHAVWPGRVIFAKAFRGYGNLLILDHDGGYYSLYAQARELALAPGAVVKSGDLIGYSGFEGNDVVYFEIRRGSTPIDPQQWLEQR